MRKAASARDVRASSKPARNLQGRVSIESSRVVLGNFLQTII